MNQLNADILRQVAPRVGGQKGAKQAKIIQEDGAVLAACLVADGADDPAAALRRYESLRLPRVRRLQDMSRANKVRFHLPDGPLQAARDDEWAGAGDRSPEALRWLYGFDADALEQKLTAADIAFARVNGPAELARHPHLRRITIGTPSGPVSYPAPAEQRAAAARRYGPVPALGQHTDTVRAEFMTATIGAK